MDIQPLADEARRLHLNLTIFAPSRGNAWHSVSVSDTRPGLTWSATEHGRNLDEAITKMLALLSHRKPIVDNYALQLAKARRKANRSLQRQGLTRRGPDGNDR